MTICAKLPLHCQAGSRRAAAELSQMAGGNRGAWRCNGTCAAVGALMAAASSSDDSTECRVLGAEERQIHLNHRDSENTEKIRRVGFLLRRKGGVPLQWLLHRAYQPPVVSKSFV
ncbi:MAG: hypothetical protein R3E39_19755 [Anaerolineae bacterium]